MTFDLSDRLTATEDKLAMSGIQAIIRIPLDQVLADKAAGQTTGALISGYRGSPVGGMDSAYESQRAVFESHNIRFVSGVNEDLAATVVWGSQLSALEPDRSADGVIGMWYGKGPGVDRSGDALRHANYSGVDPKGGVLVVAGDDPSNKSSTIPSASEWSLSDLAIPVLFPGSVQEVLDLGRYGYELSRYSGAWIGLKIQTNVADGYASVNPNPGRIEIVRPTKDWQPTHTDQLLGAMSLHLEEEVFTKRLAAAKDFVFHNNLDRITGEGTTGIVAAGAAYYELAEVLDRLNIDDVRLYKPAMIWPLEERRLLEFAHGLERIIVVEEKRSFLERQIKDILYATDLRPLIFGKSHFPIASGLTADQILEPLAELLGAKVSRRRIPLIANDALLPNRTAYFCSGCPHNRSTVVPEGSSAGGGIGCHGMSLHMDRSTVGITHMGGEGAQYVGISEFTGHQHRFQNLGDGTMAHSGSLAIRQAVSAGTNITYKILFNGTVAMTGGQDAAGEIQVPELTHWLKAEGVVKTVVLTDDTSKYSTSRFRSSIFASNSTVKDRDELDAVQRELREISGVTALIYDQGCAAELRRGRKRGTLVTPTTRVMINEAICEGCGDCGEVSNCASVYPVDTPLGRKTQIHQESCNFDLTCVEGNCPAFITVEIDPEDKPTKATRTAVPDGPQPPEPIRIDAGDLVLVGIGGTGVVTMSQVISTAAMLDGKEVNALDQTGLAQKGGTVVSNLRIADKSTAGTNLVGDGQADGYLIFDLVSGTSPSVISRASADRTKAVVSTGLVPTGDMVSGRGAELFPQLDVFRTRLAASTKESVWLDTAGIARQVFASQPMANVLVVGVAYQLGIIPVSAESIEQAMTLNGVAVEMNIEAFRLGRRLAIEPGLVALADSAPVPTINRVEELTAHSDSKYAKRFTDTVALVERAEASIGRTELSNEITKQLFHVMAYKDEYEVARLALDSDIVAQAKQRFGPNAKVSFQLKPPTLKHVGIDRKTAIPEAAARKMFEGLLKTKRLRNTRLDPFGRTDERKRERQLVEDYIVLARRLAASLTADNYDKAVEIAHLVDQVRGFDDVKIGNLNRYERALVEALSDSTFS